MMIPRTVLVVGVLALAIDLSSQSVPRLLDLNLTPRPSTGSEPRDFADVGGLLLFSAQTEAEGRELWASDGTVAGTRLVSDFAPGPTPSNPVPLGRTAAGAVFLTSAAGSTTKQLWRTDGTLAGTQSIGTIQNVWGFSLNHVPVTVGSTVFFVCEAPSGSALICTDGTAAGTVELVRLPHSGTGNALAAALGNLYLLLINGYLWVSDGTVAGTNLLAGAARGLTVRGNLAYFLDASGGTLWATDGTLSGTAPRVTLPVPALFASLVTAGDVFIQGQRALLATDGTPAGTRVLGQFSDGEPSVLTVSGQRVFFSAADATFGRELWISDGTIGGTQRLTDLAPGSASLVISHMIALGSGAVFAAAALPSDGTELWGSDGTAAGTGLLASLPGSAALAPGPFVAFPAGRLIFAANDPVYGRELWSSDGTPAGTGFFADLWPAPPGTAGSDPSRMVSLHGGIFMRADDGVTGHEPWISDGTLAGTRLLRDIAPGPSGSSPLDRNAVLFRGLAYFSATDPTSGTELWRSDGTTAGTQRVADLVPGPVGSDPILVTTAGERAIVGTATTPTTGNELLLSDGTAAGTRVVDLAPGVIGSSPSRLTAVGNWVAFSTDGQVWVTDGTVAGTRRILQMAPNERVYDFARLGDTIYFIRHGELWRSDGTAAGTAVAVPSSVAYFPGFLREAMGRLFLGGYDSVHGLELWESDGSPAGTRLLADLVPGPQSLGPGDSVEVDAGLLVFDAAETMYITRGTTASTMRVRDLSRLLGTAGSRHVWLNGTPGLFRSDGSVAGTVRVLPYRTFGSVATYGGTTMVAVDDEVHGLEPWVVDRGAIAESFGHGCNSSGAPSRLRVQDPVLGTNIALTGDALPPGSAAAILIGGALPVPLVEASTGCAIYLDPNRIAAVLGTLSVGREYRTNLRIPLTPSASGVTLAAQAVLFPGSPPLGVDLSNAATMTLGR